MKKVLSCLTSVLSICQNVIFLAKKNVFKCREKICFIWVFLRWNSKKLLYCGMLHQHPQIFPNTKFHSKIKILRFGTKLWVGILKKLMSYLKSASSNVLTCKTSSKNKKYLNLGPKIPYLGVFGLQVNKNYYQFFNQNPRIVKV